jgi:hypothetical protein
MPALFGKAAHDPDAYLKTPTQERAKPRSWICNPKPNGQGPGLLSPGLQSRDA